MKVELNERTLRGRDFTGTSEKTEYSRNNNEENQVALPNMPAPDSRVICFPTRLGIGIGTGPSWITKTEQMWYNIPQHDV